MNLIKVRLYHTLGTLAYQLGYKSVCNYLLCKSEELDVCGEVWGEKLPPPEKGEV